MNKTVLIIVIVVSVLLVGAVGGGFFLMWSKLSSLETAQVEAEEAEAAEVEEAETIGTIFPLETFIVNLADDNGKRYLRVTMNLELAAIELEEELNQRLPQIRDIILMILPTKRFEEIRSVDGKLSLRSELMTRLNALLNQEGVKNIYFTEFVVQ